MIKLKLKEFITTKPALQKILKGFLHTEEEGGGGEIKENDGGGEFNYDIL
jgi:hypothetical protein